MFVRLRPDYKIYMPCTKLALVSAINSFATARLTGDESLQQMSAAVLEELINGLEFAEEPEELDSETEIDEEIK